MTLCINLDLEHACLCMLLVFGTYSVPTRHTKARPFGRAVGVRQLFFPPATRTPRAHLSGCVLDHARLSVSWCSAAILSPSATRAARRVVSRIILQRSRRNTLTALLSTQVLDHLGRRSLGQFIYASTLAKCVSASQDPWVCIVPSETKTCHLQNLTHSICIFCHPLSHKIFQSPSRFWGGCFVRGPSLPVKLPLLRHFLASKRDESTDGLGLLSKYSERSDCDCFLAGQHWNDDIIMDVYYHFLCGFLMDSTRSGAYFLSSNVHASTAQRFLRFVSPRLYN